MRKSFIKIFKKLNNTDFDFFDSKRKSSQLLHLYRSRISNTVKIDQDMILISQIPRSGGTLLNRLFDNNKECHVYPVELLMGLGHNSFEYKWPLLDLNNNPNLLLSNLIQFNLWRWLENDFKYWKFEKKKYPFIFFPLLCKSIFKNELKNIENRSQRYIFNSYWTSFFNAWVDNQNLYGFRKKWVVAFAPNMGEKIQNIKNYFSVYPSGKYISIIRDPRAWYASSKQRWPNKYSNINESLHRWEKSINVSLELFTKYPENVILIDFDNLIRNTKNVMVSLSNILDIKYSDSILHPTFNGMKVHSNSSFESVNAIDKGAIGRYKLVLKDNEIKKIENQVLDKYFDTKEHTTKILSNL